MDPRDFLTLRRARLPLRKTRHIYVLGRREKEWLLLLYRRAVHRRSVPHGNRNRQLKQNENALHFLCCVAVEEWHDNGRPGRRFRRCHGGVRSSERARITAVSQPWSHTCRRNIKEQFGQCRLEERTVYVPRSIDDGDDARTCD